MKRHDRAFTMVELMVVVAVVGIAAAASMASIGNIYKDAQRREEANAAVALMKKARADALASSAAAAIETIPDPDGVGVKVTVALIRPQPSKKPCEDWKNRAESKETVRFELLDFAVTRGGAEPNLLCFEPGSFRLMEVDGATLSPVSVDIEIFPGVTTEKVTVQPAGTISSTLDTSGFTEGLATTINVMEPMPIDNMVRYISEPDALEPDLVIVEAVPPPAPTEPTSDPALDPLPEPKPAPEPTPSGCTSNANCLIGEVCVGGFCYQQQPTCLSNADCFFDEYCDGTYCVYDPYLAGCGTTSGYKTIQTVCY